MPRYPLLLYIGDVLAIFLFALVGRQTHSLPIGVDALFETFSTAAPFIIGWLLAAPLLGAYRPKAWSSPLAAVKTTVIAFIPAFIIGILGRAFIIGRFSPTSFYLAAAAALLAFLLVWRLIYTVPLVPLLIKTEK